MRITLSPVVFNRQPVHLDQEVIVKTPDFTKTSIKTKERRKKTGLGMNRSLILSAAMRNNNLRNKIMIFFFFISQKVSLLSLNQTKS